jgi:hypothetical protein
MASVGIGETLRKVREWRDHVVISPIDPERPYIKRGIGVGSMWYGIGATGVANPSTAQIEIDPNGEIQTVSSKIPLWPSRYLIGIKPDSWAVSRDAFKFHVAVVDLSGKPVPNAPVKVDLFERKTYTHRKRLVGGFYAYEHSTETKRIATLCEGKTDSKGLLAWLAGARNAKRVFLVHGEERQALALARSIHEAFGTEVTVLIGETFSCCPRAGAPA